MVEYFMIDCIEPSDWEDSAVLRSIPLPVGEESWRFGKRFQTEPAVPIPIELVETHNDRLLEFYNITALVMTKKLVQALREGGVDNLDVYEALIRHPGTGFETREYVATNLIGLVAASNLANSIVVGGSTDRLIDVDFNAVTIDEVKTKGLLMFRLAENTSAVVVHEKIKSHLLQEGFTMLDFIPPAEWIG